MKTRKNDNIVLVFEPACDAHWMKDVVQFPNALAQELYNKNAILITRPNHKQSELAKHIRVEFLDEPIKENVVHFKTVEISKLLTDQNWYLKACKKAADFGGTLILYPWYGDPFKGGKIFKKARWRRFRKAKVILKTDGLLQARATQKADLKQRVKDVLKYFFIDKIINENRRVDMEMRMNNPHFAPRMIFLPNCPLDIFHHKNENIPFFERAKTFLFVGRIDDYEKGVDILLDTWIKISRKLIDWELNLIGTYSDTFRKEWEGKISNEKIFNSIHWLGDRNPQELIHYYQTARTVICSSRKESGPIILSEAILCGCSFIGTAVGEIPDVLDGLPGVVKGEETLEKLMLQFAQSPEIAYNQAALLHTRMKDRKWSSQVKKICNHL